MEQVQEALQARISEPADTVSNAPPTPEQAAAGHAAHRVLMVLESLYPAPSGGSENQVRTLCRHLARRGIRAEVVVPMVAYGRQVARDRVDQTPLTRLPYPKLRGLGSAIMLLRLAIYLIRERHNYDAIHAHIAHYMSGVSCVLGRWLGKPVVIKVAGGHEMSRGLLDGRRRSPQLRLLRWMLRHATYIQATSTDMAQRLVACGFDPERIRRIPNAVDMNRFQPRSGTRHRRNILPLPQQRIGVFVGRLVAEKWLDGFFTAWERAVAPDDDVGLVVVGDGAMREALERQVAAMGRSHQITFVGSTRNVAPYLEAADFGILPSLVEGLSNTLLEYMASGLPVFGSQVSGTEDLVADGRTGWLFPTGDVDAAACGLRRVLAADTDTLHVMGVQARQQIEAEAGAEAVVERLLGLYGINGSIPNIGLTGGARTAPDQEP